ncbi:hypothetical protein [Pseudactinotalea sp. HY158]|uniref:hypothetical protein n=1 Tax=Pseudactinotalea sp. HY158 TaxID=2654547 RepID=UPI00129C4967|nr:hypothetical protein [Pseudactinotalea sp. HY158]QGH68704.1 hypothetical protein GCE65_03710 [Pseudactinotalea sp. HY158]
MRVRTAAGIAVLALLAGCAGPATAPLEPQQSVGAEGKRPEHVLVTVLSELHNHFTTRGEAPTQVISPGATVQVAAEELAEELDLGRQARDFAIASGFEMQREAAQASPLGRVESVAIEAVEDRPFESGGVDVHLVTVRQEVRRESGPITESQAVYAVAWQERVSEVEAVTGTATLALDNGVDLTTARGAVQRFLDLAGTRDLEAIRRISDDANANPTAIDVLRSLLGAAGDYQILTLPQAHQGNADTVYVINEAGTPIARFTVTTGPLIPTVVYFPTA